MSIPQLPGANPAAAYNPAAAAAPGLQPQPQQPAYFGAGVRFGAAQEPDSVELSTDKPADASDTEQQEGEQAEKAEKRGGAAKKALVKFGLAAACAAAGVLFPPAFAGAALFGVLAIIDLVKGGFVRRASSDDQVPEADAAETDASGAESTETGDAPAETAEVAAPDTTDVVDEPTVVTEPGEGCQTLAYGGETIKLSEVRNLIEDDALKARVKTADVARVISEVLAEQYDNVEPVSPRATNKQIDTELAKAVVGYITDNPDEFTA